MTSVSSARPSLGSPNAPTSRREPLPGSLPRTTSSSAAAVSPPRLAAELNDGEGDLLDRVRRWANAEGNSRPGPEDLARFRHRVLLGDPHLRALQRAGQQDVEDLIAQTIADESHLPLLDEIARRPAATRQVFTDELMGDIDDIASRLDPTDLAAARTDALTVFGLMVGTCSSPGH